ncbi:MAG TPA: hypothetical protein PKL88_00435 [bacterium]|nr:hypothetical protein [bacterium]
MDAQTGVRFLLLLKQAGKADQQDLEKAVKIAESESPSRAIKDAQMHHYLRYGDQVSALGFGKGTRWLAIIRRDDGDAAFHEKVAELEESFK